MWREGLIIVAMAVGAIGCAPTLLSSARRNPPLDAQGRALHCVDVSVAVADAPYENPAGIRLVYALHNRCGVPIGLDFAEVSVEAAYRNGQTASLGPRGGGAMLDAFDSGSEGIRYEGPDDEKAIEQPIAGVCVDVSRLEVNATPDTGQAPICFRRTSGGFVQARARTAIVASDEDDSNAPSASIQRTSTTFNETRCDQGTLHTREYEWCESFATWSRNAPIAATIGVSTHRFALGDRSINPGTPFGSLSTAGLGAAQAETVDSRVTWTPLPPLYLGGELDIGGAALDQGAKLASNPDLSIDGANVFLATGIVVGLDAPRVGPFEASAEFFAGGWLMGLHANSPVQCDTGDGPGECGAIVPSWWLEPRARVVTYLTPHLSVDAWGGLGLSRAGEWSSGGALSWHFRSFDGAP